MAPVDPAVKALTGFGRFEVQSERHGVVACMDHLMGTSRPLPDAIVHLPENKRLRQCWHQGAFISATYASQSPIAERPASTEDSLFWQFPCRTEASAWQVHEALSGPRRVGDEWHVYLGLPWATWIDKARKQAWGSGAFEQAERQWRQLRIRLAGIRMALSHLGLGLRAHTVCQHIYWRDLLPRWSAELGITDLWLSHCPAEEVHDAGIHLRPWRLFAVNVEDVSRSAGLDPDRDCAQRTLLASFIGAYSEHYLNDTRLRLQSLKSVPDIVVEVTNQWHFEDVVYRHQVQSLAAAPLSDIAAVKRYNKMLTDSVFALCPPGAGANTLRLWEALASGTIPVLFDPMPQLPQGGSLPRLNWDDAVVRFRDADISKLVDALRRMPLSERRRRQARGRELFSLVRGQTCF